MKILSNLVETKTHSLTERKTQNLKKCLLPVI
jgi:hypothetical protein